MGMTGLYLQKKNDFFHRVSQRKRDTRKFIEHLLHNNYS